jgi:hypothetical protein
MMDPESGARMYEQQQSERQARAAGRKARLAEGVRSVFVQRLGALSLSEAFTAMDLNGDGVLSVDEFKKGLRALKIGLAPWEVGEFVSVVDSDLSGFIDRREFIDMFSRPSAVGAAPTTGGADGAAAEVLPGAKRGSKAGAVFDRELSERLDGLESMSAAIIDPDEYGSYTRADALDADAMLLVSVPNAAVSRLLLDTVPLSCVCG